MKVDLHSHTAEHSSCARSPALEMVRTARERGLDGVVISDHRVHLAPEECRDLEAAVPGMRVFRGVEIGIGGTGKDSAAWEDLVIVSDAPCAHLDGVGADEIERLGEFRDRTGALMILAHPFRYHREVVFDLDRFAPDAIEIASLQVDPNDHDRIAALARQHGMQVVSNSDAHHVDDAALFYVDLDDDVTTERELADAIRRGAFVLGGHGPTIASRGGRMAPIEDLARAVLAEGGTADDFLARGGGHASFFDRVAGGGSYQPNARAIGLRNPPPGT